MGRAANLSPVSGPQIVAMLVDVSDCIGCKACEVACKEWNQKKADPPAYTGSYQSHPDLTAYTWTLVRFQEGVKPASGEPNWNFLKYNCMHCSEAECVEACPVDALYHEANGVVNIDLNKCVGAGECVEECPYGAVHLDRSLPKAQRKAGKCTMCYDRISNGLNPACVQACPTDCIKFGARDELLRWGLNRVNVLKKRGFPNANLYGVNEQEGLHNLYVLTDTAASFGITGGESEGEGAYRRSLLARWLKPAGRSLLGAALFGLVAGLFKRGDSSDG